MTINRIGGMTENAQDWHAFTARRLVAHEFRIAESALMQPTRATKDVAFARQIAMYLAHVVYSMSYNEVAQAFGRERSTVSHACARVEDARDDADFDERLCKIEQRLQQLDALRKGSSAAFYDATAPRPDCPTFDA